MPNLLPCIGQAFETLKAVFIVGAFAVLALVVAAAMFDALRASWRAK